MGIPNHSKEVIDVRIDVAYTCGLPRIPQCIDLEGYSQ